MTASGSRIHDLDVRAALCVLTHHHVAREQQADVELGSERLVGQRRVAGAEDHVRPELDTQLLPHRGRDVDLGEHTEALGRQLLLHPCYGLGIGKPDAGGDPVSCGLLDHDPSS